jgi:hypothetical protein
MSTQLSAADLNQILTLLRVGPVSSSYYYGAATPSETKVAARLVQRHALGSLPAAAGLIDALRPWKDCKCASWVVEHGSGGAITRFRGFLMTPEMRAFVQKYPECVYSVIIVSAAAFSSRAAASFRGR